MSRLAAVVSWPWETIRSWPRRTIDWLFRFEDLRPDPTFGPYLHRGRWVDWRTYLQLFASIRRRVG